MRTLLNSPKKLVVSIGLISFAFLQASCAQSGADKALAQMANKKIAQHASKFQVNYVTALGAKTLLDRKAEIVVLDIRTPEEVAKGHIDRAVFADFYAEDFRQQLTKLDPSAHYIVHCRSGGRSTKALTTLKELGFTKITHMDGGLRDWNKADLPLTQP